MQKQKWQKSYDLYLTRGKKEKKFVSSKVDMHTFAVQYKTPDWVLLLSTTFEDAEVHPKLKELK